MLQFEYERYSHRFMCCVLCTQWHYFRRFWRSEEVEPSWRKQITFGCDFEGQTWSHPIPPHLLPLVTASGLLVC